MWNTLLSLCFFLQIDFIYLRVRFFKKITIGCLNPKEPEKGFCVSLLKRSIQDLSDDGASKKRNQSQQNCAPNLSMFEDLSGA